VPAFAGEQASVIFARNTLGDTMVEGVLHERKRGLVVNSHQRRSGTPHPSTLPVAGCLIVLAIFAAGYWLGAGNDRRVAWSLPATPIYASATDSSKDLVIATGHVAEDIEGLFALDGLSGDLQCTVFNPTAQAFNAVFRRNVLADLQIDAAKSPRFLMVTGEVLRTRRTTRQIGESLAYVVETGSGKFAIYAVPWRRELFVSGRAQQGDLILLQAGSMRTAAIRE
jgi:hypothetical protein